MKLLKCKKTYYYDIGDEVLLWKSGKSYIYEKSNLSYIYDKSNLLGEYWPIKVDTEQGGMYMVSEQMLNAIFERKDNEPV